MFEMWHKAIVKKTSTLQHSFICPLRSTVSSPSFPLWVFLCAVCVCFRYLSQFGMRALQLHADQTRWRDKEGGWEERPVETKRESSWRVLALNWIVFLVSSIRSSRPNPPLSRPAFLCVFIYIYISLCVWEGLLSHP